MAKHKVINIRAEAAKIIDEVIFAQHSLNIPCRGVLHTPMSIKRDHALLQEICIGSLRWFYKLDYLIKQLLQKPLKKDDHIIYAILVVGFYQLIYLRLPEYAAISETVNAARVLHKPWAVALLNGVFRNFLRNKEGLLNKCEKNIEAKYSHPKWFIAMLQKFWPNDWVNILQANNEHPPMYLRVNLQKITREAYVKLLAEKNIPAIVVNEINSAITLQKPVDITELPNFTQGWVSVQDLASQLAAEFLELQPNLTMLDACAAPGGKLCHILETEAKLKSIVAIDHDAERLLRIKENLVRLDLNHNVMLLQADAANFQYQKFDRILLDAPCSATGVIRRHPDIKLLRQQSDIKQLANKQLEILQALWQLLNVGGILLYATCSILPEENSEIIKKFLQQNVDAEEKLIETDYGIAVEYGRQILPGKNGMDGFYYAKLIKKNGKTQ